MSLTFKLLSLAIRTAAKPIGNYIKRQAKEHDGFRRFAVAQAQRVHRIDMRMRLGILHDSAAQERMHEREQRAAADEQKRKEKPTVRTEEEQRKHDEEQAKAKESGSKPSDEKSAKVKIRPLSEAKAIELGANFFSEAFIFAVAAGLLVWDSWRNRRKESSRRDMVAERLESLEGELDRIRSKYEPELAAAMAVETPVESPKSWYNPASWWTRSEPVVSQSEPQTIPGNVPTTGTVKPQTTADNSEKIEKTRTPPSSSPTNSTSKTDNGPSECNSNKHVDSPHSSG